MAEKYANVTSNNVESRDIEVLSNNVIEEHMEIEMSSNYRIRKHGELETSNNGRVEHGAVTSNNGRVEHGEVTSNNGSEFGNQEIELRIVTTTKNEYIECHDDDDGTRNEIVPQIQPNVSQDTNDINKKESIVQCNTTEYARSNVINLYINENNQTNVKQNSDQENIEESTVRSHVINVREQMSEDRPTEKAVVNNIAENIYVTNTMGESHVITITNQPMSSCNENMSTSSTCNCNCHENMDSGGRNNTAFENDNNETVNGTVICVQSVTTDGLNEIHVENDNTNIMDAQNSVEGGINRSPNGQNSSNSNSDVGAYSDSNLRNGTNSNSSITANVPGPSAATIVHSVSMNSENSGDTRNQYKQFFREVSIVSNVSTQSTKPPTYSSLGEYIIHDEPPKYEEITGNKLDSELEVAPTQTPQTAATNSTHINCRSKAAGFFILFGVILVTSLLVYLSLTKNNDNPEEG